MHRHYVGVPTLSIRILYVIARWQFNTTLLTVLCGNKVSQCWSVYQWCPVGYSEVFGLGAFRAFNIQAGYADDLKMSTCKGCRGVQLMSLKHTSAMQSGGKWQWGPGVLLRLFSEWSLTHSWHVHTVCLHHRNPPRSFLETKTAPFLWLSNPIPW